MSSSRTDTPDGNRASRRAQVAGEVRALGDDASAEAVEHLLGQLEGLQLGDAEVAAEIAELRARLSAAQTESDIRQGRLPVVASLQPLPPGDQCHFAAPARFGRRRSDQYGHLALTSGWLRFHGAQDLSVTWGEVASTARVGQELVVSLHDSRRLLRFECPTAEDAATAGVVARHLAAEARQTDPQDSGIGTPQAMH